MSRRALRCAVVALAAGAGGCLGLEWEDRTIHSTGEALEDLLLFLEEPMTPLKQSGGVRYEHTAQGTFDAHVRRGRAADFTLDTGTDFPLRGRVAAGGTAVSRNTAPTREFAAAEVLRITGRDVVMDRSEFLGTAHRRGMRVIAIRGRLTFRGVSHEGDEARPVRGHLRITSRMNRTD